MKFGSSLGAIAGIPSAVNLEIPLRTAIITSIGPYKQLK
jgi:hypothetical protein